MVALLRLLMSGDVEGAIQLTLRAGNVGTGMDRGLDSSPVPCVQASVGISVPTKVSETDRSKYGVTNIHLTILILF